jgi:hypothetical protein
MRTNVESVFGESIARLAKHNRVLAVARDEAEHKASAEKRRRAFSENARRTIRPLRAMRGGRP